MKIERNYIIPLRNVSGELFPLPDQTIEDSKLNVGKQHARRG